MLVVHFSYRIKTQKYTTRWLEFIVIEAGKELKMCKYPVIEFRLMGFCLGKVIGATYLGNE